MSDRARAGLRPFVLFAAAREAAGTRKGRNAVKGVLVGGPSRHQPPHYPAEMPLTPQSTLAVPVSAYDHVRGPVDAPVTVVEYGDYECPYCAAARPVLAALAAHSADQVRLVFRNFPLADIHPFALTAALAAEAAAAYGAFWPMHDLLFANQDRLRDSDLARYAERLGLRGDAVIGDAAQPYGDKIEADFYSGIDSGVRGTPTIFLNGRRYAGRVDLQSLRAAVSSLPASRDAGSAAS